MAQGYWILKGDKTSCGGQVLDGLEHRTIADRCVAFHGGKTSCGKHSGVYQLVGGHPSLIFHGFYEASTLYSYSNCPCKARLVPSITEAWHTLSAEDMAKIVTKPAPAPSLQEPTQHAQAAKKKVEQLKNEKKEKREITLTLGIFFDGTGNNATNTDNMLEACTARHYNLADAEAENILGKCAKEEMGVSSLGATSYIGYYTNIHWLHTLYKKTISGNETDIQKDIYIDGIGTEAGKSDSMTGMVFGTSDTGVIAKTNKAVNQLTQAIKTAISDIQNKLPGCEIVIKTFQFDIFGFSRGAAASRHFANRIQSEEPAIINAIREGVNGTTFEGAPAGKTRFIGIFDTVAAIGTPANGLNPHSADTGDVKLALRPGVAEKVFHITAANECRFNFALNSVKPAWPELALPGVHSDIGGGYLPIVKENLFLTRPETDTVPLSQSGTQTRAYRQTVGQLDKLDSFSSIASVLRTSEVSVETWSDSRMPPTRYGEPQKRSYAAITLRNRIVKNAWSKVVLRVMLDAAQDAGVLFDPIRNTDKDLFIPSELTSLCEKARLMGKATRSGKNTEIFTQNELDSVAEKYIHCSASWNAIVVDTDGLIRGGASPAEIIGFVNRPDEQWQRTVYNMDEKKV